VNIHVITLLALISVSLLSVSSDRFSAVSELSSNFDLLLLFTVYVTNLLILNLRTCVLTRVFPFFYSSLPPINIDSKIGGFAACVLYVSTFKCFNIMSYHN
jgi:hypothetical protein